MYQCEKRKPSSFSFTTLQTKEKIIRPVDVSSFDEVFDIHSSDTVKNGSYIL